MVKGRSTPLPVRVVGIGASAGGLDALRQLIAHVPLDTGYAFVVLQHLPPSQTGELAKLLAPTTALPVIDLETGTRIKPNTIFIVPPHTSVSLARGTLLLRTAKTGARPVQPIDSLFTSLAKVLKSNAVGILLSGSGHDGSEGLRSIQQAGGLTLVQDVATAQFDEMPRNAIAAGVAELVMSPAELGQELGMLATVLTRPQLRKADRATPAIDRVLEQLREASGIDFTSYKRTTIERRLARRIAKFHLASLEDYSAYLVEHPEEANEVYEDLLIHVTEFFRDRDMLERLMALMVPEIERSKAPDAPVRVWVPGCSTGEELYSLAILLVERCGNRTLQLFGSDLSQRAIEVARQGRYPATISSQVSPERLARFFTRDDTGYRIKKEIRERCVFVQHDLVSDPPFSKLDLVSCRNVLIYLGPPLQKRVMPIFHYALQQPGFLLLGRAETTTGFEQLFAPLDAEARIYGRRPAARSGLTFPTPLQLGRQPWRRTSDAVRSALDIQRDVDYVLLARYAPPCVLVNEDFEVLQYRGRTGPFLEQPPGHPQLNVLRMVRQGIAPELTLALQRAQRNDKPVRRENVIVRDPTGDVPLHLEVVPLRGTVSAKRHFLIVFEAIPPQVTTRKAPKTPGRERRDVVHLKQELVATKEYLHSLVTQHLATSEELGVTNEELQSANEELQSTNEELQTAKEELQSTNEELETVNEELNGNNELLHQLNDDLINVLASVEIAIIIVDNERKVRRFTPKARGVMKLIPSDIGRPIGDLMPSLTRPVADRTPSIAVPDLDVMVADVIDRLELREAEVRHPDGTWYRMQVRPYRTIENTINGATISFVDITALHNARDHANAIVEAVTTPLVAIDDSLRVQTANRAFVNAFGQPAPQSVLSTLGDFQDPELASKLRALVTTAAPIEELEFDAVATKRVLRLAAREMPVLEGQRMFLVSVSDITAIKRAQELRETQEREKNALLDAVSHELRTPLSAILLWAEALRHLPPTDARRGDAVEAILDSAHLEAQLVDDLLDVALSRHSEPRLELAMIEAAPVVEAAISAVRADADQKQITLGSHVEAVGALIADGKRLRQIASGLVSNAVKFTPAGGTVDIELTRRDGNVELRVTNSGPPIPADVIDRVFEPFVRGDTSKARSIGGLGIGLALVRHFVERHGGTVEVTSLGGERGTTFTVRLPAAG